MLPRVLPKIQSFDVRVDSSLGEGSAIPAEVAESLAAEAMSIAAEDGNTSTDVCLRMLPQVHEAASKQFSGQVRFPILSPKQACEGAASGQTFTLLFLTRDRALHGCVTQQMSSAAWSLQGGLLEQRPICCNMDHLCFSCRSAASACLTARLLVCRI